MKAKIFIWFAQMSFGGWLGRIGARLHREHMKPVLREAFGPDFDECQTYAPPPTVSIDKDGYVCGFGVSPSV